jgi:excisionase family DNA binding protein
MPLVIQDYKFYTVQEIAAALRVTPQTVRGYVKQGKLAAQRVGRPLLVSEGSLKAFLDLLEDAPTSSNITLQK